MTALAFNQTMAERPRHRTDRIEAGPERSPLVIFLHGWLELGLVWRGQTQHFAAQGWRCIAPDMRGYGRSSRPTSIAAYAVRESVADAVELHDALGGSPTIWVGHDWGSPVVWAMASHHVERCTGVVNLTVPCLARGYALPTLIPLLDRVLYPEDRSPVRQCEADVRATPSLLFRSAPQRKAGEPALTAFVRVRRVGLAKTAERRPCCGTKPSWTRTTSRRSWKRLPQPDSAALTPGT